MSNVAHAAVESSPLAYTIDGATSIVPVSKSSLRKLIADGTLPTVTIAGRKLIRHEDLVALVERGTA